jgi:NAD(P)-dependent dehydrogenase (short-subunit alcohol dehydrogenase family)
MDALEGKVIAVTGASGIAPSAAHRFAAEEARVQVFSLDGEEAAVVATELSRAGSQSFWAPVDLTDGDATEAAFAAGGARLGEARRPLRRGRGLPLSDEPRMISGQVLAVDGGWSATDVG